METQEPALPAPQEPTVDATTRAEAVAEARRLILEEGCSANEAGARVGAPLGVSGRSVLRWAAAGGQPLGALSRDAAKTRAATEAWVAQSGYGALRRLRLADRLLEAIESQVDEVEPADLGRLAMAFAITSDKRSQLEDRAAEQAALADPDYWAWLTKERGGEADPVASLLRPPPPYAFAVPEVTPARYHVTAPALAQLADPAGAEGKRSPSATFLPRPVTARPPRGKGPEAKLAADLAALRRRTGPSAPPEAAGGGGPGRRRVGAAPGRRRPRVLRAGARFCSGSAPTALSGAGGSCRQAPASSGSASVSGYTPARVCTRRLPGNSCRSSGPLARPVRGRRRKGAPAAVSAADGGRTAGRKEAPMPGQSTPTRPPRILSPSDDPVWRRRWEALTARVREAAEAGGDVRGPLDELDEEAVAAQGEAVRRVWVLVGRALVDTGHHRLWAALYALHADHHEGSDYRSGDEVRFLADHKDTVLPARPGGWPWPWLPGGAPLPSRKPPPGASVAY
jgi:hypothetical protein